MATKFDPTLIETFPDAYLSRVLDNIFLAGKTPAAFTILQEALEHAHQMGVLDATLPTWGTSEEHIEFVQQTGKTEPDSFLVELNKQEYEKVKRLLNAISE